MSAREAVKNICKLKFVNYEQRIKPKFPCYQVDIGALNQYSFQIDNKFSESKRLNYFNVLKYFGSYVAKLSYLVHKIHKFPLAVKICVDGKSK